MSHKTTASRFMVLTSALLLAACADAPTAVEPPGGAALSRGASGDRLAALFEKASPAVMALGGTVFADNDERIGKLVFGVENASAIPGVTRALAAVGAASGEYVVQVTEPVRHMATLRDRFRPVPAGR